ncbi:uncharacterized protein [Primulina huaijiensis]|uniref:uncharacterized protein n=1 Tax=Primulina huaijiensis TaxID=1492673 RepID=UPI003CC6EB20
MEGSGNERLDPFFNCVQAVKNVVSPLESNFRKIAKNFENCVFGVPRNGYLNICADDTAIELVRRHCSAGSSINHHGAVNGDVKKNANFPVEIFTGLFARNCGNDLLSNASVCANGVENLKEMCGGDNDWKVGRNLNGNVLHFEMAWSVLTDGFFSFSHNPIQDRKSEIREKKLMVKGGRGACINGFSSNLKFGRVKGVPLSIILVPSVTDTKDEGINSAADQNGSEADSPQKLDQELLDVPLSNKEGFGPVLSTISPTELSRLLPSIRRSLEEDHPDKKKLLIAQAFFRYTEAEGKNLFQELNRDDDGQVSFQSLEVAIRKHKLPKSHDREFMYHSRSYLLPLKRLQKDSQRILSEAANVGAVSPNVEIPADSVFKSALAGGISCSLSAAIMHPIDTIKTQVQASTLSFSEILSMVPQLGVQGLYKGSIPAILGQFSSHGLRTGICEASKCVLIKFAPTLPEIQVQSLSSFCSTFLGTIMRIPCEVLKQRLQVGLYGNVGEAIVGTWQQNGLKGFFRGTGMTLCREIPFYVAGSSIYDESKKAAQKLLGRELQPWETVVVGALSGGFTAVLTTPFDVIKTRMMTASEGQSAAFSVVLFSILRHEGPLGLFKGAIPRFFWVAPLGAMNFAGYELIRKAMD